MSCIALEQFIFNYLWIDFAKLSTTASANRRTLLSLIFPSETAVLISGSFRPDDVVTIAEIRDAPRTRTTAPNAVPGILASAALRMAEQIASRPPAASTNLDSP